MLTHLWRLLTDISICHLSRIGWPALDELTAYGRMNPVAGDDQVCRGAGSICEVNSYRLASLLRSESAKIGLQLA